MNIFVNEILKDINTGSLFRILWIDEGKIITYLIDINESKALPFKRNVNDIIDEIIKGELLKIKEDPYLLLGENQILSKHIKKRDEAWKIIKDIVINEPSIFEKEKRSKYINSVMAEHGVSYPTVRKYLSKYWQRGKTKNSLLPDYHKSGGKGKTKSSNNKKRGRPRKYPINGVNVDNETKKIFRTALEKYYLTAKQNSLTNAYNMMIREFYAKDFYYENGVKKVIIEDENKIPTIRQFRYWYDKEYNVQETTIARKGEKKYNKDFREVLGTSTEEVTGPGSRFQVDATVADVFLISEYNSDWIIGRPIVYLVADVFSRMVVGLYIGLEGPSWIGAMMALANTASDKQEFCKNYDIEISHSDWPCNSLPEKLLADRGEFEGYNIERLINAFNIHVENAAPYRADLKGIVEKYFDTVQRRVKPFLPGYIDKDYQERGARDYRLDAKLNLKEFTQIIIKQIFYHNTKHYLEDYPRNEGMIRDNVKPIPLELWNWGEVNCSGKLNYYPEDYVKIQLLPRENATVTHKGIKFKNMYYSCDKALKESWFPTARQKGSWKLPACYDPRNMSNIYLLLEDSYQICNLLDHQERYKRKNLEEIEYLIAYERQLAKHEKHNQTQKEVDLINESEEVVKNATKKAEKSKSENLSKKEQVTSIKENRKFEKEKNKSNETFTFSGAKTNNDKEFKQEHNRNKKKNEMNNYERPSIKDFLKKRKKGEENDK